MKPLILLSLLVLVPCLRAQETGLTGEIPGQPRTLEPKAPESNAPGTEHLAPRVLYGSRDYAEREQALRELEKATEAARLREELARRKEES